MFVVCSILLSGCMKDKMSFEELQSYVVDSDNGLSKSVMANGIDVTVTYRPPDLWVHQDVDGVVSSNRTIDSLRYKYSQYYYFILSLSRGDKEALQVSSSYDYGEIVQTMAFRMSDYVTLTSSEKDTVLVGDFVLNRTQGIASSTDMLFAFGKEKIGNDKSVQFNLKEFGLGTGDQQFTFLINDLQSTPRIDFGILEK